MPHHLLHSWLFSIEQATVAITRKYPRMVDKDVLAVYNAYHAFFVGLSRGKDLDDPYSPLKHRQNLIDEIWEVIAYRERAGADDFVPAGELVVGGRTITDYDQVYAMGFNDLRKSVRRWSKRDGPKGYINFVREQVEEALGGNHSFHGRSTEEGESDTLQESLDKFATRHGIALSVSPTRELPEDVTEEQTIYYRSYTRNPAAHVERLREIHADLPQYPQLTNDLIGALYAAGHDAEATQLLEQMIAEHPDYLIGVAQYVNTAKEPDDILDRSSALGPNREITAFPPGTGGRYHLQEFLLHEAAVINVLTIEEEYEASIRRLQRLLDLGLPPLTHRASVDRIAVLCLFIRTAESLDGEIDKNAFALPPEVAGAEAAVELVRESFKRIVRNMQEDERARMN